MGLSIHYSGKIKTLAQINELMVEVVDICKGLDWEYHLIQESNEYELTGVVFSPARCEAVFLTILPDGRICSPISLMNKDLYVENGLDPELVYTTSTKTQYAGPDAHIAIIKLLRHLKEKYFSVFELSDEGGYWETMDEKILLRQFALYESVINSLAEVLSEMEADDDETAESLAEKIECMLKEKLINNK